MSTSIPKSWNNCATCERWAGARKLSVFRDQSEVEDTTNTGECVGGGFDRMPMSAMQSCSQWELWGLLK
jgi:hypothetical protein